MRNVLTAILFTLSMLVFSSTDTSAQFRFGFDFGCAMKESNNPLRSSLGSVYISGMSFALRSEYNFNENLGFYTAPFILLTNPYDRIEIQIGAKYRVIQNTATPYVSGGFGIAHQNPVIYRSFIQIPEDPQIGPFTYRTFNALFHVGLGLELGSFNKTVFTLELRFNQGLVSISDPNDPENVYTNELSVSTGFLFR